jgi:pimeloyl-ACP methyl ester carboxylesterase
MTLDQLDTQRHITETPSGPISYVDVGDGPPALFIHGVGLSNLLWRDVIAGVSDMRRCLALDLPLHGHSPARPDQDFSVRALGQLLDEFCESLDLDAVDLVANDTGGAIAQVFAARHPQRIRSLTLTNCDTRDNLPPEGFLPTVELAAQGQLAPFGVQLVETPELARTGPLGTGYEDPAHLSDDLVRAYLTPVVGDLSRGRQFERCLTALVNQDLVDIEPLLAKLTAPTLLVWGTGDELFPTSFAYWLRDLIPGATEVVEIPGAKLFFPDERPDDLIPHLRRHWAATA